MSYILQNAVIVHHKGNAIILNSRHEGIPETYKYSNKSINIDGGKIRFIGDYDISNNDVIVEDLRLTYDSPIEDMIAKLLWVKLTEVNNKHTFTWIFANELPICKLERLLEDTYITNPQIFRTLKQIYNEKRH